jgi:1,4-alpha-glucan branching enzyme
VTFRVWAPDHAQVEVVFEEGGIPCRLSPEGQGVFAGRSTAASVGSLYRYR